MGEIRIGVSGWAYPEWRGVVYPDGLVQKRELEYVSGKVNTIEINGTFYSLQSPKSFRKWAEETPEDFLFSVKGSKFITHQKKLQDVRIPLANFFASGLLLLGKKLGPILWQFAPIYKFDPAVFEDFLRLLPKTAKEAADLALENTIKSADKAWTELIEDVPIRYAFEPRHASFFTPEFVDLLSRYNCALAFADTADKFDYAEDLTADFVYIRLHGNEELYASDYRDAELDRWSKRLGVWKNGGEPRDTKKIVSGKSKLGDSRDIFVYFDNTMKGHAVFDAIYLSDRLGVKRKSPIER